MLTTHNIDIQAMLVWLTLPFYDFFAVLDPSPLTVCINCSFFTFMSVINHIITSKKVNRQPIILTYAKKYAPQAQQNIPLDSREWHPVIGRC